MENKHTLCIVILGLTIFIVLLVGAHSNVTNLLLREGLSVINHLDHHCYLFLHMHRLFVKGQIL